MTPDEAQDLRDWSAELTGAERSRWEPRCVARAFRSAATTDEPLVFTMQVWIDLEAAASPFLLGKLPEAEEAEMDFAVALRAFGHEGATPEALDAEELVALGWRMVRMISSAFAMGVRLAPPEGATARESDNGIGQWLPTLACLVSQLGMSPAEALALPVGQALALIVAHRCNQGWRVTSETYAQRDAEGEE